MAAGRLTHIDAAGRASMVDVTAKPDTERVAVAAGEVHMRRETLRRIREGALTKGDVLATARIAGIMAAKRTHELIPLCHPLPITKVAVDFRFHEDVGKIEIQALVKTRAPTGVEMEALTAVTVAALTIYDMAKAVEKEMTIDNVRLIYKAGGKSGTFVREDGAKIFVGPTE